MQDIVEWNSGVFPPPQRRLAVLWVYKYIYYNKYKGFKNFPRKEKNMNIWTYNEYQNTWMEEFLGTLFQSTM